MKTLVISYLPRGNLSNTKKLLDIFLRNIKKEKIEHLDLTKNVPDFFMPSNLMAYMKRNYGMEELNSSEKKSMHKMDKMTEQFKKSDIVVIAFPMHNFSLPAPIKAYFDSVMLKGETWDMNSKGFVGLMKGKKALILMTSGGKYEGEGSKFDYAMSLAKAEFQFMGFDEINGISIGGTNMSGFNFEKEIENSQKEIKEIVGKWYK